MDDFEDILFAFVCGCLLVLLVHSFSDDDVQQGLRRQLRQQEHPCCLR